MRVGVSWCAAAFRLSNFYRQVIDESKRAAAQKIGGELFTIVHSPKGSSELTH